jgi:excisionase family DNA binding protein
VTPASSETVAFVLPEQAVERIAERAATLVLERLPDKATATSPYLSVIEAADYVRAKPQRIYDLLSSGRLTRHKDGRRVLVLRAQLDAYLAANGPSAVAPSLPPLLRNRSARGIAA